MDKTIEQQIEHLVKRIEARRAVGMGYKDLEDEIRELQKVHGTRKIQGTSKIVIPMPKRQGA
jgi:predicted nuclease of restriction endonuclease-like RecB superfamily